MGDDVVHIELLAPEGLVTLLWHGPRGHDVVLMSGGAMGGMLGQADGSLHDLGREFAAWAWAPSTSATASPTTSTGGPWTSATGQTPSRRRAGGRPPVRYPWAAASAARWAPAPQASPWAATAPARGASAGCETPTCSPLRIHGDVDSCCTHGQRDGAHDRGHGEIIIITCRDRAREASGLVGERVGVLDPGTIRELTCPTEHCSAIFHTMRKVDGGSWSESRATAVLLSACSKGSTTADTTGTAAPQSDITATAATASAGDLPARTWPPWSSTGPVSSTSTSSTARSTSGPARTTSRSAARQVPKPEGRRLDRRHPPEPPSRRRHGPRRRRASTCTTASG